MNLDRVEARRSIIQIAGQNNSHHTWSERRGGIAEKRIDGGPTPVFLWAAQNPHPRSINQQKMIGRGNIDMPAPKLFAIARVRNWQRGVPADDLGQHSRTFSRNVQDDEDGGGQIRGEAADQSRQRIHSPGRGLSRRFRQEYELPQIINFSGKNQITSGQPIAVVVPESRTGQRCNCAFGWDALFFHQVIHD